MFEGVAAGFDFFWNDLADGVFDTAHFEIPNYKAAVKKWGQLQFDECFGYTPLLGLGGNRKVDNLRKVKIKEHIGLITQSAGKAGTQSSLACDTESTSANRKWVAILGLAYFFILIMILGAAGTAVILLIAAREIRKRPRLRILAIILLLLAGLCAAAAFCLAALVWREPPWGFHFQR